MPDIAEQILAEEQGRVATQTFDSEITPKNSLEADQAGEKITPDELFAEHVEAVRQKGDAIDAARRFWQFRKGVGRQVLVGLGAGELATFTGDNYGQVLGYGLVGATTAAALVSNRYLQAKRVDRQAEERFGIDTQVAVGERYDLYRVRQPRQAVDITNSDDPDSHLHAEQAADSRHRLVLRWYGSYSGEEGSESDVAETAQSVTNSLLHMARLAADNGIEAMQIPDYIMSQLKGDMTDQDRLEMEKRHDLFHKIGVDQDFFKAGKNLSVINRDNKLRGYSEFNPRELRDFAISLAEIGEDASTLESLISTIRADKPDHPLVQAYENYRTAPTSLLQALKPIAKEAVQRHLDGMTVHVSRGDNHQAIFKVRESQFGYVHSDRVDFFGSQTPARFERLRQPLEIDDVLIARFESEPHSLTLQQRIKVAEYKTYLLTQGIDASTSSSGKRDTKNNVDGSNVVTTQDRAFDALLRTGGFSQKTYDGERYERLSVEGQKLRKLAGMLAIGVAVGLGVSVGYHHEDTRLGHEYSQALKTLPQNATTAQREDARHALERKHPDMLAFEMMTEYEGTATDKLVPPLMRAATYLPPSIARWIVNKDTYIPSNTDIGDYDPYQGSLPNTNELDGIGNVQTDTPNEIAWRLSAQNMDTSGYWALHTNGTLDALGLWHHPGDGYQSSQAEYTEEELPLTPEQAPPKSVTVSRVMHDYDLGHTVDRDKSTIDIPVLDGTMPVAADVRGQQVSLIRRNDGTYALEFPHSPILNNAGSSGELTGLTVSYTLAPSSMHPHATENLQVINDSFGYPTRPVDESDIWKAAIPDLSSDPAKRLAQQTTYVQNTFRYSLQPLPSDMAFASEYGGWRGFTEEVLRLRQANCNVAAALIALSNPQLNEASGFMNSPNGNTDILSAHESHAWLVDSQGQKIDATPGTVSPEDQAFFDESVAEPKPQHGHEGGSSIPALALTAGSLAAAGAALRYRRGIAGAYHKIEQHHASVKLDAMSDVEIRTTLELARNGLYAPAIDLSGIRRRAERSDMSRDDAINSLASPDITNIERQLRLASTLRRTSGIDEPTMKSLFRTIQRASIVASK
jgi:hypothetical protein